MASSGDLLTSALAGRYRIERELGAGGMATVYLAHDLKHHRSVAIKVLRPELAAAMGPERFLREIEIVAGLTHPHIVPLFDSGDAAGQLFYVMPFVAGESLRARLEREKQLPIAEAMRLTVEVADALGAAHLLGIVHRDIKPENILLEGGHAVVTDFGIARAISVAGGDRITETGIAVGTPAYMSPEQSAGEGDLDGRSDVYSLACVAYEMLIGHPPFLGSSALEVLARHTADAVPPLRTVRESVPEGVEHAITRALAKLPADRYATAQEFAVALGEEDRRQQAQARHERRARTLIGVASAAAVIALAVTLGPRVVKRAPAAPRAPTVVVLPSARVAATSDDWFAEGMVTEISGRLTKVSGLRVIAPRSAAGFATSGRTMREFANEVGAQYALDLTVEYDQAAGGPRQVRVSPQLVRVSDGQALWADHYTDTLTAGQIFDVQADIAEHVAQKLDITLQSGERDALRNRPTENPQAYEAFLLGNRLSRGAYQNAPRSDRLAAITEYRRAIALDPRFAEARARLSVQYAMLARTDADLAAARAQAESALELRPDLAWGHYARARYAWLMGDGALVRSETALAELLGQNSAEMLEASARLYWDMNEYEKMARNYERAVALDPLSWDAALSLGVAYFGLRRYADAVRQIDRAVALDSTQQDPYVYKAWLYLSWRGSAAKAVEVLQVQALRFGPTAVIANFLAFHWWASRLLARDPWYRSMLERVSLGSPNLDSASYYSHKAALYEAIGQPARARAYWDSLGVVAGHRLRDGSIPLREGTWSGVLAMVWAAKGDRKRAIAEAQRSGDLRLSAFRRIMPLALVLAELGDAEEAAAQFEQALAIPNWVSPAFLGADPTLQKLRGNPRFRRLLDMADTTAANGTATAWSGHG